jgi:putative ABC transport system permease protein
VVGHSVFFPQQGESVNLITLAARNLRRRVARTVLVGLTVAFGVALTVSITAITEGFARSLQRTHEARGADLVLSRITERRPMPSLFAAQMGEQAAELPGVVASAGMLWELLAVDGGPTMIVYGWEPGSFLWEHLRVEAGTLEPPPHPLPPVFLGTIAAGILGKTVGETVVLDGTELQVAAVFHSPALVENGALIFPLPVLQNILQVGDRLNFVFLRLAPGLDATALRELRTRLERRFRGLKTLPTEELAAQSPGLQAARALGWAVFSLALLAGTTGVFNAMLMTVSERKAEIALLVAVGWRRRRIMGLLLFEAAVLSFGGALLGVALGFIMTQLVRLVPLLQDKIEPSFSPFVAGVALVLACGAGLLGGIYPARKAASMLPARVLAEP